MIKRHLLQPMIPGTIHPLHHQLSLHPRLDPYLLNPFHHALPLPMMDTTSIEKRIGNSGSSSNNNNIDVTISRNNNNDNNNRPSSTRPLRSFLIEDILKHSPKRSHVPPSETVVSGATSLSCDSPPLPPASIRNNKHHRASSDRDSQDSSSTITTNNRKSPKKEPESTSSTPSPKSSTTSSEYNNNNNLTATLRESHKLLPDTTKGKDPNLLCNPLSSLDGKDVVWPAWVYCTRYSDRPSSGMYYSTLLRIIIHSSCLSSLFHTTIIHHLIHHVVKFVFLLSSHPPFHLSTWDL